MHIACESPIYLVLHHQTEVLISKAVVAIAGLIMYNTCYRKLEDD